MELQQLKSQVSRLIQAKELIMLAEPDWTISETIQKRIDNLESQIKEKIIENNKSIIYDKTRNFKLYQQCEEEDIKNYHQVGKIFDFQKYHTGSKGDRCKYIIIKITPKMLICRRLNQLYIGKLNSGGGYETYIGRLKDNYAGDNFGTTEELKIKKDNIRVSDFFDEKNYQYELNKTYQFTEDHGN